jgi:hypothetical protein
MGGTLAPASEVDGERLIEHCHVVSSRARLLESGHLSPGETGRPALEVVPDLPSHRLSASG